MAVKNSAATPALFSYKQGNGFIYRVNPAAKFLFLAIIGCAAFFMNIQSCIPSICIVGITAFAAGFSAKEQFAALVPAFIYIPFLYMLGIISGFGTARSFAVAPSVFIPQKEHALAVLRMCLILLAANLMFRTTTLLQIRQAAAAAEQKIRRGIGKIPFLKHRISQEGQFAFLFGLFLSFFPMVFSEWRKLEQSWKARGGKNGLRKIKTLLPLLLSSCLYRASITAKATANRS